MNTKFVSIKSVLYELSTLIPEQHWNELHFLEWASKGLKRVKVPAKFQEVFCLLAVEDHKCTLPEDLKYIVQIVYNETDINNSDSVEELKRIMNLDSVVWNPALNHMENPNNLANKALQVNTSSFWKPMTLASTTLFGALSCNINYSTQNCNNNKQYRQDNNTITTDLKEGVIGLIYLKYPEDCEGDLLIPDNETLKEAIRTYCLYMYFSKKSIIGETNAYEKAMQYKIMFGHMAAKASAELNQPDIGQLENIKNMTQRLMPISNHFDSFFSNLNKKERLTY